MNIQTWEEIKAQLLKEADMPTKVIIQQIDELMESSNGETTLGEIVVLAQAFQKAAKYLEDLCKTGIKTNVWDNLRPLYSENTGFETYKQEDEFIRYVSTPFHMLPTEVRAFALAVDKELGAGMEIAAFVDYILGETKWTQGVVPLPQREKQTEKEVENV